MGILLKEIITGQNCHFLHQANGETGRSLTPRAEAMVPLQCSAYFPVGCPSYGLGALELLSLLSMDKRLEHRRDQALSNVG